MNTFTIIILSLIANALVGATIWTSIDNEEGTLQKWYARCPVWWLKPLIIHFWILAVLIYFKRRPQHER